MCPLRLILIFLSATFAGFLVLKGLNSKQEEFQELDEKSQMLQEDSKPRSARVVAAINTVFWICVDMASGRYLWRNLQSSKQSLD